jgi:hypothetical protein
MWLLGTSASVSILISAIAVGHVGFAVLVSLAQHGTIL